jgi:hypothetical protein
MAEVENPRQVDDVFDMILGRRLKAGGFPAPVFLQLIRHCPFSMGKQKANIRQPGQSQYRSFSES